MNRKYRNLGIGLLMVLAVCAGCSDDLNREDGLLNSGGEGAGQEIYNPFWGWVGTFPGWVSQNVERLGFTPVEIKGDYHKVDPASRIGFQETPWFSTGMYAAPGEVITIVKPSRLTSKVKWRIGAWNCILPEDVVLKRYNQVYETGYFDQDTMRVKSYFGGNIYIVPEEPFKQPETFIIQGAVKSPDFILGKTDEAQWKEEIQQSEVPFAELVGERCIWTMSLTNLRKIQRPAELVELYDDIIRQDFDAFHGFREDATEDIDRAPSFPVRVVQDLQLCQDLASHPGYPIVLALSDEKIGLDVDEMRGSATAWNFYKEVGKNYQTWCWSWWGIKEVSNLLPYYYSRNRLLKAWPEVGDSKVASGVVNWEYVITEYVKKNGEKDFGIAQDILTNNNARMMPFIQLAQQYGWKLYAYLGECARRLDEDNSMALKISSETARRDFFCERVCEYANANLLPFFDAWGIKCSATARQEIAKIYGNGTSDKFWETWEAVKIPDVETERTPGPAIVRNYQQKDIEQGGWTLKVYNNASSEGKPENVIDGDPGTWWSSDKNIRRPLYNPQPWIEFDMKNKVRIEYFNYTHRDYYDGGSGKRVLCQKFKLEIRDSEDEEWKPVGEFETEEITANGVVAQRFDLTEPVEGRYLKLTFIRAFNRPGQTADDVETGAVCLSDFGVGGKVLEVEDDIDFPEWN